MSYNFTEYQYYRIPDSPAVYLSGESYGDLDITILLLLSFVRNFCCFVL